MKTRGIVRRVDELGRIVLPKSMRTTLDIKDGDELDITLEEDRIVLKKNSPACLLCGSVEDAVLFRDSGKRICRACIDELKAQC